VAPGYLEIFDSGQNREFLGPIKNGPNSGISSNCIILVIKLYIVIKIGDYSAGVVVFATHSQTIIQPTTITQIGN